jgi:alanine-glyoxylate transaminase/(R)-3-amino-2-methylpropionate-pyruvate transaminase
MTTSARPRETAATPSSSSRAAMPPCDHVPKPYAGPALADVLAMRKQFTNPAVFTVYSEPLMIVEGWMQYLYDEAGRRYLDLFAGIVTVSCGHSHPRIVAAMDEQLHTLQHTTTIYLHPTMAQFAKKLASRMPRGSGLDVTYFVNSGSEANDLAVTMARLFTGNFDVIAVRNGYHGGSPTAMGLTSHRTWKLNLPSSQIGGVHHAINPDPYRSPFSGSREEIATRAAEDIRDIIRYSTPGKIAAFIAEPIQGVGGATHGAPNYLREAYAAARDAGGLCIADEVQTGFGRTGDHYWGFENFGVTPDFVTMAKGIGNGAPLAAVTTRMDIAKTLTQRLHFNTYGGNPISMAAGLAVLDTIEADGLQENARVVGMRLKDGLTKLMHSHPLVGDVRGMGLMLGVELVRDRATKEAASRETADVLDAARERGVLVGKGGLEGNVLRIKPPMCISAADADFAVDVLDEALTAARRN